MGNAADRELERKFVLPLEFWEAPGRVADALGERAVRLTLSCKTTDFYWKINQTSSQFVRLRDSWGETSDGFSRQLIEITAKAKDKGNNWNRREVDLKIDNAQQGYKLLEMAHGAPMGRIKKLEWIAFCHDEAVISIAQIARTVYLEVEAPVERQVAEYVKLLEKKIKMVAEPRSFFEIYVEGA